MLGEFFKSFLLGLATPLTAACVLPLYPSFISYLANHLNGEESRRTYAMLGGLVMAGIISFMLILGLVFTTLIGVSLTIVTQIISPLAFGLLAAISILMILNKDLSNLIPSVETPKFEDPLKNAFALGFFFGAIVLPCNPGYIAVFLARATLFSNPASSLTNFFLFGSGMGAPLFAFTFFSSRKSKKIINLLKRHDEAITRFSGLLMLGISLYYLIAVFKVISF